LGGEGRERKITRQRYFYSWKSPKREFKEMDALERQPAVDRKKASPLSRVVCFKHQEAFLR
jgi:hypothetical protein